MYCNICPQKIKQSKALAGKQTIKIPRVQSDGRSDGRKSHLRWPRIPSQMAALGSLGVHSKQNLNA